MASSATSGVGEEENQKMEEDGGKGCFVMEHQRDQGCNGGSGDTWGVPALKKDDSGITLDSYLSNKSEEVEVTGAKSPSISLKDTASDADMNDSEWLNDSAVPSSSLSESGAETKSEDSPVFRHEDHVKDGLSLEEKAVSRLDDDDCMMNEQVGMQEEKEGEENDKDEVMSIDKDELLNLDTEIEMSNPLKVNSGTVHIGTVTSSNTSSTGHAGSPGAKRMTNDDDDSPKPKRRTPDRPDDGMDKDETVTSSGETDGTNTTEAEQKPEDLPDLTSDSDDDEEDSITVSAAQRRLLRRRNLRQRLFGREKSSSDESDTTDDEEERHEGDKNPEEDEKESDEEVRKITEEILNKATPKPNWFAVPELIKREYGHLAYKNPSFFREHVQGSLQMVKRLVLAESMKGHEGCVNALSFNRIGTLLASGSDDLNIVLWNWQRARPSLVYDSGHRSNVFQAKFMPFSGDCHVISCARDGQVRLAELSLTGVCKATRKLAQHRGAAHKLALEYDSPNVFLSCGEDALTYLFDLREDKPHKLVTTKENDKKVPLYSIHSNPCDSRQFCVGGRDHYIRVYDKRKIAEDSDGGVMKKFCPDHLVNSDVKANVTCACYNYNGSEILGSYNDEDIYLFDNTMSDGANFIHRYTGHRNNATVKGVNFYGPKSEFIVSGSDCGHIYFWDKETEAIINFQEGDDAGVVNVLEPHPTLPILATSGLDHDVKLWMPSQDMPQIDADVLKKTLKKNRVERNMERVSTEPEMIGGQMLWFIMHHFRNSARRRMREEGQVLSSSDDDNDSHSEDSDTNEMQCAQS